MDKPYIASQNTTLGERIKNFRQRAGISQFNLEIEIGAAPGSLSRIEAGKVNPSKETLLRIINALNLKSFEAMTLFDLELDELPKVIHLAQKINSTLDIDHLVQIVVDEIVFDLGLFGGMMYLIEGEHLYAKTLTNTWYSKLVDQLLPKPLHDLSIKINESSENLVVKSILNQQIYFTKELKDLSKDVIPDWISDFVQKVNGTKCLICIPLIANGMSIGAVSFSKEKETNFDIEYKILKSLADYVATAVINAKRYAELAQKPV